MSEPWRVGITGLQHELNSFVPGRTTLDTFRQWRLHMGEQMLTECRNDEVSGALGFAADHHIECEAGLLAFAGAGPVLDDATYEYLRDKTLDAVARMVRSPHGIHGLYLPMHGAMAAESYPDTEADLIQRVRDIVGPSLPIVASFDMHAHLTRPMTDRLDGVEVFQTCPHTDYELTGFRAMQLLYKAMSGARRPVLGHCKLRLITAAEVHDTDTGPMVAVQALARKTERQPGILSVSIAATQPWMDVPDLGWSVVVTADGDAELAQQHADRLGRLIWDMRADFNVTRISCERALDVLCASTPEQRPYVLVDASDAPSAGSFGDSAFVLSKLLERGPELPGPVLLTLTDAAGATACHDAGVGATLALRVGASAQPGYFEPVNVVGTVVRIADRPFHLKLPPANVRVGRSAVLSIDDRIFVLITEEKVSTLDLQPYLEMGLDPLNAKACLVKSAGNYRHHWIPIAYNVLDIDTPGPVDAVLPRLPFRRITRPLWPFDPDLGEPFEVAAIAVPAVATEDR